MREVDSAKLRAPHTALGLSGPAADDINFDDGNVQNALDVSRLIPGEGIGDGWFHWITEISLTANGTDWAENDPYTGILEAVFGLSRDRYRVWLIGIELVAEHTSADGNMQKMAAGYAQPADITQWPTALTPRPVPYMVCAANQWQAEELDEGTDFAHPVPRRTGALDITVGSVPNRHVPVCLKPGAVLLDKATAENIAVAGPVVGNFHHRLWIGARGLNPPGVA